MDIAGCWRYSRGYVGGFLSGLRENVSRPEPEATINQPNLDDPELLLAQAQQEMKESQAKNRGRAVQAITQKNNLQAEVDKTQKMVNKLRMNADLVRALGDENEERQQRMALFALEEKLVEMKGSLAAAIQTVETIKTAMRGEHEHIRAKTAQAMALKTQWKQSQIAETLGLTVDADTEFIIKPMRGEIQALIVQANRLNDRLWQQAERVLRNGNRALARAILTERAAFQNAFSSSSSETATF